MKVWVGIALSGGKVVRLDENAASEPTVYAEDPIACARHFAASGADGIHLVDLDAAIRKGSNRELMIQLIGEVGSVPVQVGGGLKDRDDIVPMLSAGAARVILGSILVSDPEAFYECAQAFPGRVLAGIDTVDRSVMISGWKEGTTVGLEDAVLRAHALGAVGAVVTDISRYGRPGGPNVDLMREISEHLPIGFELIVSGGITSTDDLAVLKVLGGVAGAVVGRAVYEGQMDLRAAQDRLSGRSVPFR